MKQSIVCILTILTSLFISCEKETEFDLPVVFTGEVTNADQNKAILNARIYNPENLSITESGFIWGLHSMDKNDIIILNPSIDDIYSLQTNYDLLPGKTYYVRAFVKTANNTVFGREVIFKTDSLPRNLGNWTKISEIPYLSNENISCSFSHNNNTYFILQWGEIFRLNHLNNKIDLYTPNINFLNCSFSCIYQNNAYIFKENAFYRMNLADFKITKLTEWSTNKKYGCSGFLTNDDIYICLGSDGYGDNSKEVWRYSINLDEWTKLDDFPGVHRVDAFSFSIDENLYLGGGLSNNGNFYYQLIDFWSFNPVSKKWQQRETLPNLPRDEYLITGTSCNNIGYCAIGNSFLEYNATFNIWERISDFPEGFMHPFLFSYRDSVFAVEPFSYDISDNSNSKRWVDLKLYKYEK